jgi:hypothetical protein
VSRPKRQPLIIEGYREPKTDWGHYLRDKRFWCAVLTINLVSAPFVGFGRAMTETWFR